MPVPDSGLRNPEDFFEEKTDLFTVDSNGIVYKLLAPEIEKPQYYEPQIFESSVEPTKIDPQMTTSDMNLDSAKLTPTSKGQPLLPSAIPMNVDSIHPSLQDFSPKKQDDFVLAPKRKVGNSKPVTTSDPGPDWTLIKENKLSIGVGLIILTVIFVLLSFGRYLFSTPTARSSEHLDLRRPTIELSPKYDTWKDFEIQFQELYRE